MCAWTAGTSGQIHLPTHATSHGLHTCVHMHGQLALTDPVRHAFDVAAQHIQEHRSRPDDVLVCGHAPAHMTKTHGNASTVVMDMYYYQPFHSVPSNSTRLKRRTTARYPCLTYCVQLARTRTHGHTPQTSMKPTPTRGVSRRASPLRLCVPVILVTTVTTCSQRHQMSCDAVARQVDYRNKKQMCMRHACHAEHCWRLTTPHQTRAAAR